MEDGQDQQPYGEPWPRASTWPSLREHPRGCENLAEVAKQVLAPLGVRRKRRSRTWLDDHGWLGIVELQPSNWGTGSYLNVGPMFLWQPSDHLILEGRARLDGFSAADDAVSFQRAIRMKAEKAKEEFTSLRRRFASLNDVTTHYETLPRELSMNDQANLGTQTVSC